MHDAAGCAAIMIPAGIGIPVLAALNAGLGVHLGSSTAASLVLFAVAFGAALSPIWRSAEPSPASDRPRRTCSLPACS